MKPEDLPPAGTSYIGRDQPRVEDLRFITGRGSYVDGIAMPGATFAAFVRSTHPHARVLAMDARAALAMPGVLGVLTAQDWAGDGLGAYVVVSPVESSDGVKRPQVTHPMLAGGKVCYVGQPVALVVAETRWQALDAAEAVEVDYEPLPAAVETRHALDPGVPVIHAELGSNLIFDREAGDRAAVEAAFRAAAHVTSLELQNNRITANPIEPRAILANYDGGRDQYTLWVSHQAPHVLRRDLAENTLRHPEHRIRVVAPDVGGGFGMKAANHPEEPVLLWASRRLGRPVRWTSTRSEGLVSDAQARDHWTRARMAFDAEGRILAIDVDTIASLGAFQTRMGASIPAQFYSRALVGLYRIPAACVRVRGAHTNAPPVQAYRGAGRPEAVYVLERLAENGARELGIDVAEMRARNFIRKDEFPYTIPLGLTYDSGDPQGLLDKAKALLDYDALMRLKVEARAVPGGRLLGVGCAAFMDAIGTPSKAMLGFGRKKVGGWDSATVRVHPNGQVTVLAGSHSHGQSHATTFAQIAADRLGRPIEDIEIVEGDTDIVQFGHGTWGSRSTVTTGLAIVNAADRLVEKCRRIAAHLQECDAADIVYSGGEFRVSGTDRALPFQSVVDAAYQGGNLPEGMEPALEAVAYHDPADRSYAAGLHLCAVEVDRDTGRVTVLRYAAIDDCGRLINPMVVEGQAHGGIAQGAGQALMEDFAIDRETGQPLAGSFMDYAMPRAADLPMLHAGAQETPAASNLLGVRPAGESGTIGALSAVSNAVIDALWPLGVRHIDTPITSQRVWDAIRRARGGRDA
ncbi:MAG: xanthine dehydrogenase family protein molybdopterin-binding subunit [Betaproteobacteria bacterium]